MNYRRHLFIPILFFSIVTASAPLCANADGLMRGGHINGPYTTLPLTKEQQMHLRNKKKTIKLTPHQQLVMCANTGVVGVSTLSVFPKTIQTCTCELRDIAAQINTDTIEVANNQFGLKLDLFRYNDLYWRKINEAKSKEDKLKSPPEEIQLRKAASSLKPESVKRSSELLKKAIAINPDYTLGRQLLALNYTDYSEDNQTLPQRKLAYTEAIDLIKGRDAELEKHLRIQLCRIEAMIKARAKLFKLAR